MSTRCQIGFYASKPTNVETHEVLIYRHCDGYPDGVLPDITPILKDFAEHRGLDDIEYASAWLVAKLKDSYWHIGICGRHGFHGDIEYYYAVYPDAIDVYDVTRNWKDPREDARFTLLQTVSLK
jgi:hypothetical protein